MSLINIHQIQAQASNRIGKTCKVNVYYAGDCSVVFDITWKSKDLINKFSHSVDEFDLNKSNIDVNYMVIFAFETQIKKYNLYNSRHETLVKNN